MGLLDAMDPGSNGLLDTVTRKIKGSGSGRFDGSQSTDDSGNSISPGMGRGASPDTGDGGVLDDVRRLMRKSGRPGNQR